MSKRKRFSRKSLARTASLCGGLCVLMPALLLTGCDGGNASKPEAEQSQVQTTSSNSVVSDKPEAEQSQVQMTSSNSVISEESKFLPPTATVKPFQAGTWHGFSKEDGREQYYFFGSDGNSGQVFGVDLDTGVPFAYEYENGRAVFHMGSADDSTPCNVEITGDGSSMTLKWDNGTTETLTYVSSQGAGDFTYLLNDDLEKLALAYYQQTSGSQSQNLSVGIAGNEDGTVTIQIYENLGDHNSTAAWYTVDRVTGKGTDRNSGKAVDLTSVAS